MSGDGKLLSQVPVTLVSGMRTGDIRPDIPGLEIFYLMKSANDPEAFVTNITSLASSWPPIWSRDDLVDVWCPVHNGTFQNPIQRGHGGWIGDVRDIPGMEICASFYWEPICCLGYPNEECHFLPGNDYVKWVNQLYSSSGEVLGGCYYPPIDWDGIPPREEIKPPGYFADLAMRMDVIGDYREEFVILVRNLNDSLIVITNASHIDAKKPSPMEDRNYFIDTQWTGYR